MSHLVGNPQDRFSRVAAHIVSVSPRFLFINAVNTVLVHDNDSQGQNNQLNVMNHCRSSVQGCARKSISACFNICIGHLSSM